MMKPPGWIRLNGRRIRYVTDPTGVCHLIVTDLKKIDPGLMETIPGWKYTPDNFLHVRMKDGLQLALSIKAFRAKATAAAMEKIKTAVRCFNSFGKYAEYKKPGPKKKKKILVTTKLGKVGLDEYLRKNGHGQKAFKSGRNQEIRS